MVVGLLAAPAIFTAGLCVENEVGRYYHFDCTFICRYSQRKKGSCQCNYFGIEEERGVEKGKRNRV